MGAGANTMKRARTASAMQLAAIAEQSGQHESVVTYVQDEDIDAALALQLFNNEDSFEIYVPEGPLRPKVKEALGKFAEYCDECERGDTSVSKVEQVEEACHDHITAGKAKAEAIAKYAQDNRVDKAAIRLISVGWMRRQWDPKTHRAVPNTWLANYVVGKKIKTFPRCQDLPQEAYKEWDEVEEDLRIAVSHRWQTPEHPTPSGSQFSEFLNPQNKVKVQNLYLEEFVFLEALKDEHFIFFDFLSLFQWPRDGDMWKQVERDDQGEIRLGTGSPEETGFQLALEMLTEIFQTWTPFVMFTSDDEFQSYQGRSWCYFEIRQMLQKFKASQGKAFLTADKRAFEHVQRLSWPLPPLPEGSVNVARFFYGDLQVFLKDLLHTSVTNGSDRSLLARIYTQALAKKIQNALDASAQASAAVIIKALQYTTSTMAITKNDSGLLMTAWRKNQLTLEDFNGLDPGLQIAAILGSDVAVKEFSKRSGANLEDALWEACCRGHQTIADYLITARADINRGGEVGSTPLFQAARYGHADTLQLLIDRSAALDKATEEGLTPTYIAAQQGQSKPLRYLLDAKADANKANDRGTTPLLQAAFKGSKGHVEAVQLLLTFRADPDKAQAKNYTPTLVAAYSGQCGALKQLIAARADLDKAMNDGRTPSYVAAEIGDTAPLKLLLDAKADANKASDKGRTPADIAKKKGHTEALQLLRAAGAIEN